MIDAASSSLTLDASVRQALVFQMAAALAVIKLNVEQKGLRECSRNWALFVSCTRHTIWKRASDDSEWGRVGKKGQKKCEILKLLSQKNTEHKAPHMFQQGFRRHM